MSFASRVVWITGASSGIGEALSRALLADGAPSFCRAAGSRRCSNWLRWHLNALWYCPLKLPTTSVCQSWWSRPGHGRVALTC
ncbi:SDR family oxidoreductase [Halopseudomonas pachastrellae]|nr:SDR family oxidoreductase [Halopseudomonas pachastrellae]